MAATKATKLSQIDMDNDVDAIMLTDDVRPSMVHDPVKNDLRTNYKNQYVGGVYTYYGQRKRREFDALLGSLANGTLRKPVFIVKKSGNSVIAVFQVLDYISYQPRNNGGEIQDIQDIQDIQNIQNIPCLQMRVRDMNMRGFVPMGPRARYFTGVTHFRNHLGIVKLFCNNKCDGIQPIRLLDGAFKNALIDVVEN